MKILAIIIDTVRQTISKGTLIFFFGMSTLTIIVLALSFKKRDGRRNGDILVLR